MNTKICKICGQNKSIQEFSNYSKDGTSTRNQCKACIRVRSRDYNKAYWKKVSSNQNYRDKENQRLKTWRKRNPFWNLGKLSRKFNLTKTQFAFWYEQTWFKQNGHCSICNVELVKHGKDTCVDHNHLNRQPRGLLCSKCNFAIGLLQDSADLCKKAADYLRN